MRTLFTAAQHGFRFRNGFLTPARWVGVRAPVVGLCGGMCFAALDAYYANQNVAADEQPPEPGTPLFQRLMKRQTDSLSAKRGRTPVMVTFTQWMLHSDEWMMQQTLMEELPAMRSALQTGRPVVLGLVRAWSLLDWSRNHQVVALGYCEENGKVIIPLYDPNHPGFEPVLVVDRRRRVIHQSTGEFLRGFFVIPYQRSEDNGDG